METPYLPRALFWEDFKNVYEPSEDTYLLLDALEMDGDRLRENVLTCIEIGSGSGTVLTAISKYLTTDRPRLMLATDVNNHACKTTKKCAVYHKQFNIEIVRTNMADALVGRLEHAVDLLVFNPPYVPTEKDEIEKGKSEQPIYLSWAGGCMGRELSEQFLTKYVSRLLSKPYGVAYLVALDQNHVEELRDLLLSIKISGSVVLKRRAGSELLSIIKYEWMS